MCDSEEENLHKKSRKRLPADRGPLIIFDLLLFITFETACLKNIPDHKGRAKGIKVTQMSNCKNVGGFLLQDR